MGKEKYLPYSVAAENPVSPPKTPKEQRQEKWENFWYYHKTKILLIVGAVVLLTLGIWMMLPDHTPDLSIYLLSSEKWEKERITQLEEFLCPFTPDQTGDNVVNVAAEQFVLDPSGSNREPLDAFCQALESGNSFAIICNSEIAQWLAAEGLVANLTDSDSVNANTPLEKYALEWSLCELFQNDYFFSQMELYYFCLRSLPDEASADLENKQYWSLMLIQLAVTNQPLDENYYQALENYQENCWKEYAGSRP